MSELDDALAAFAKPELIIKSIAKKYGLPPEVLSAIREVESGGKPGLTSPKGALGEFQIMPETAKSLGVNPNKFREAADGAARLIKESLERNNGDWKATLQEYHGGPNRKNWGPLTEAYPDKVFKYFRPDDFGIESLPRDEAGQAIAPKVESTTDALQSLRQGAQNWQAQGEAARPEKLSLDDRLKALGRQSSEMRRPEAEIGRQKASWGPGQELASALWLGAGPSISAVGSAGKAIVEDIRAGSPPLTALQRGPEYFTSARSAYREGERQYKKENPWESAAIDTVGSLPLTMAGMGVAGKLAGPAVEAVSPAAAKFLAGTAGQGGSGVANWLLRRGSQTAAGALQGATAAGMTSQLNPDMSIGEQMQTGGAVGGAMGALLTPAINALTSPLRAKVDPGVAQMAQRAEQLGVKIAPWRLTQDKGVQFAGRVLADDSADAVQKFSTAVKQTMLPSQQTLRTHGISAAYNADDVLGPQLLKDVKSTVGQMFDKAAARTTTTYDAPLNQQLTALRKELAQDIITDSAVKSKVAALIDKIDNVALGNGFTIPGKEFQQLTQTKSPLQKALSSSTPELREYGKQIHSALLDALDRSAPLSVKSLIGEAKSKWMHIKRLEDLVERASPAGTISPRAVANAAKGLSSGDLATLGQAGKFIPEPTAGGGVSTGNQFIDRMKHPFTFPALLGVEGTVAALHPEVGVPLLAGTAALGGVKNALGRALASDQYRGLLIQQALSGRGYYPGNPLIAPGAIFANRGSSQSNQ